MGEAKGVLGPGVKVSQNAVARPEKPWNVRAAKLLDFTAETYVSGPSKLATFAILIQWLMSHSNFTFLRS